MISDQTRSFMRRATGNELKILLAIRFLEDAGKPTHAEAISEEAMLNRATVYRLLPRLAENHWIEYRLTADGRLMTHCALTELTREPVRNITDTPGDQSKCLPGNATSPDRVAKCDAGARVNPSQNATPSQSATPSERAPAAQQLTGTKDSTGYCSPFVRQGKDLARQTAKVLNDLHSLGCHTQLWYRARSVDERTGNAACSNSILSICSELQDRYNKTGKHQGAAFTARVKQMLAHAEKNL